MLHKSDLIAYFESGCKSRENYRIGVEHEQFVFKQEGQRLRRVSYDEPNGIRDLLLFFGQFGYEPIMEKDIIIGLNHPISLNSISLEPGGQFELAGSPLKTVKEVWAEQQLHFERLEMASKTLGLIFLPKGFDSYSKRDEVPWMPKARYEIMANYMPQVGSMGLDMMKRTCTVQVNLDYNSEQDMIKKMRVATVLQPFASGYFSNSNIVEGTESLYKAYRTLVWQNTDADRCGILPFVFEDDFSFERYVDYLLDVPMYFVKRGDQYFDKAGANFKNFINGTLEQFSDHEATMKDFEDQVSIVFPEVRLKKFLEVRGADSGNLDHIMKVTQFWVDLLYNDEKLDECFEIIKNWSFDEIFKLYKNIPREGSQSIFRDKNINQWVEFFQNL